jgi:hypothetical protein
MGYSRNFSTNLCDVWADAQRSRSVAFASFVFKVWRRLFRRAAHGDQPISADRQHATP